MEWWMRWRCAAAYIIFDKTRRGEEREEEEEEKRLTRLK
jgi:hypothetical protein